MGQRTTFLLVKASVPREAIYWHWWADSVETITGDLTALPEIVVRALDVAGGQLGDGSVGRTLRQWLPRFTAQEVTEKDFREDVVWVDADEVVLHASMGEVCVVLTVVSNKEVVIDAVIANPTIKKLRGYLGMEGEA
jgi:hypothetical protein